MTKTIQIEVPELIDGAKLIFDSFYYYELEDGTLREEVTQDQCWIRIGDKYEIDMTGSEPFEYEDGTSFDWDNASDEATDSFLEWCYSKRQFFVSVITDGKWHDEEDFHRPYHPYNKMFYNLKDAAIYAIETANKLVTELNEKK